MFFHGWDAVLRVVVAAVVTYVLVIVVLRVGGARTLAKMSAYDLVVTVALGSIVASIPLLTDVSVSEGLAAIATYLLLQELTRFLQARSLRVHHIVRQQPILLAWDGRLLVERLEEHSITTDEVRAAVRRSGYVSLAQVQAVVLENDGEWSVMPRSDAPDLTALDGLSLPGSADGHRADDGRRTRFGPSDDRPTRIGPLAGSRDAGPPHEQEPNAPEGGPV